MQHREYTSGRRIEGWGLRDGTANAGERESKRRGKSERDRKGQRLRRPFWSLLVSQRRWRRDAKSVSFEPRSTEQRKEATGRSRDKFETIARFLIVRVRTDNARAVGGEKGTRKNTEPIYGDPLERIDAANSREAGCHSCVINCPVELGRDSN